MTELKDMLDGLAGDAQVYGAIERAERVGRRRRHRKRLVMGGGAALSVATVLIGVSLIPTAVPAPELGASPSVAPSPTPSPDHLIACTAKELPLPDGYPKKTYAGGGDPAGRYIVGRSYAKDGRPRLAIWDGIQPTMVAMEGSDQGFTDITTSGVAIGSSFIGTDGENQVSWIYRNGELKRLKGDNVSAVAINEKLVIAGRESLGHAIVWRTPTSDPERLTVPEGAMMSEARAIAETGEIIGSIDYRGHREGKPATDGVVWHTDGTIEVLPIPAGFDPERVWPNDIRGEWIGGRMIERSGRLVNLLWNRRTGEVTAHIDRTATEVVNPLGWTAGFGKDLKLADGTVVDLPRPGGGAGGGDIRVISDDGKTVGGTLLGDETIAVRWTCG
ncbi:hypothetical protein [Catelliglobosispora koreensis]|uniref:hypothetical protein n=1 Tax=Catelliglobosispora koreensis TaxID=129052 RepID=UPI00037E6D46|nr:hypothetical protein [Catelliglobosispora koreensis]